MLLVMRMVCLPVAVAAAVLAVSTWTACAQSGNPSPHTQENSKAVPSVVIRSETRLVQLSVIAVDKKGHAVENLKKDDFVLLDNGKPQDIALFSTDSAARPDSAAATSDAKSALPPNVFSNRLRHADEPPGSVTVILFDALNTSFTDQAYARTEVLTLLQQLQPQDHVAVYLLTNHLQVVNEFTQDSKALLQAVKRFKSMSSILQINSAQMPISASDTGIPDPKGAARAAALMNDMTSKLSDLSDAGRVEITAKAIEAIANHVAAIPGRKSLVWVSGAFPVSISLQSADNSPVDSQAQIFDSQLNRVTRALNQSNMAIYPVDARGLFTGASDPSLAHPFSPYRTPGGLGEGQDEQSTMNLLADRTGGHAFYNTNDIQGAIRRTLADSHFTYAIGYYPDHGDWHGQYHTLVLRAKKSGVVLRYRKGYYALADPPSTASQTHSALQAAVWSPVDATTMGIQAKVDSIFLATRKLELRVNVNTSDLRLADAADGHHTGKIDAIYLQLGPADAPLGVEPLTYNVDLSEKEYQSALNHGYELKAPLTIDPATKNLRVVVRDAASGVLGSVTIPLEKFLPPQTTASAQ